MGVKTTRSIYDHTGRVKRFHSDSARLILWDSQTFEFPSSNSTRTRMSPTSALMRAASDHEGSAS